MRISQEVRKNLVEPETLTCVECGRERPFRKEKTAADPYRNSNFQGFLSSGGKAPAVCSRCKYKNKASSIVNRDREPALAVKERGRTIEAYAIYKRSEIPRPRKGIDSDRCLRFTAVAIANLNGRIESMDVHQTHSTVSVKAIFTTIANVTPELFQQRCIEAMNKDRR